MANSPKPAPASPQPASLIWRALDAVYHFLASLKLAVISLASLAAVLGYATFFEKWYGTAAVQEWIYRGKGFSLLLAFLGANILCAALIRYPWKRRQTGFVVTHAGLLILIGGSWYSLMTADEGQVGMLEGEVKDELVRGDYAVVRVKQLDPDNPAEALREWELPFRPGAFAWGPGQPRPHSVFAALDPRTWFDRADPRRPEDVLTRPNDPFQFVVKSNIPSSTLVLVREPGEGGAPMAEIRPTIKAPGMAQTSDVFETENERWFQSDTRLHRVVKTQGPARFAFQYVDRPELVEEFLDPPAETGNDGVARFRYADKSGKARRFDLKMDGQTGKAVTLPDSDITVKLLDIVGFPAGEAGLGRSLGAGTIPIAEFEVKKGDGPAVKHFGLAGLPMFPNVIPTPAAAGGAPPKPIVGLTYDLPPVLDTKGAGSFGMVEVLGTPEGSLYYRVYGRPEAGSGKTHGVVRSKGPLKVGEPVQAFGGNPNMPMSLAFTVEHFYPSGVEREVAEPIVLPREQMGQGIAGANALMTIKDPDDPSKTITKPVAIRRSATLDPTWQTVSFPVGKPGSGRRELYRIAYDVDRKPLGFSLKLDDFDVGFDPGTQQAASFVSKVRLTDKGAGIDDRPVTISMNEPLTHRGYTFYQSTYIRQRDPVTNRDTGEFVSVFQVGSDPGRWVKYLGCGLVVLGAFLQFYMRAGLFTDGGKREKAKAAGNGKEKGKADTAELVGAGTSARGDDEPL